MFYFSIDHRTVIDVQLHDEEFILYVDITRLHRHRGGARVRHLVGEYVINTHLHQSDINITLTVITAIYGLILNVFI